MPDKQQNPEKKVKKEGEAPPIIKEEIYVFQFNDELGEYEELELEEDIKLYELLNPEFILLFIDPIHYRVWIWQGAETTTRMKFISAKTAPNIRDQYGISYKITSVDEGDETKAFKIFVGLEKEEDFEAEELGPAYEGTKEDLELLEELTHEKIILLLEKAGIPEGYERDLVIVKNKLYAYREYEKDYLGSTIIEKKLFPLKEAVPDGPYLAEDYVPRFLFSFNNVVLTELLKEKKQVEKKEISSNDQEIQ
jgi:hypothetical protein